MGKKFGSGATPRAAANDNIDLLGFKSSLRSELIAHGIHPTRDPFADRMESLAARIRDLALGDLAEEVMAGREISPAFLESWKGFFAQALADNVATEAVRRSRPPRVANLLLLAATDEAQREAILGDVWEFYSRNVEARGVSSARRALWADALRSIPALAVQVVRRRVAQLSAKGWWWTKG